MIRVLMSGCNGKMGQMITGLVKEDEQVEIVAGIDTYTGISEYISGIQKVLRIVM